MRPIAWLLRHCPEMRLRALIGPSLDAALLERLLVESRNLSALSRDTHATYAATHEAARRLAARGLVRWTRRGRAHVYALTPEAQMVLAS